MLQLLIIGMTERGKLYTYDVAYCILICPIVGHVMYPIMGHHVPGQVKMEWYKVVVMYCIYRLYLCTFVGMITMHAPLVSGNIHYYCVCWLISVMCSHLLELLWWNMLVDWRDIKWNMLLFGSSCSLCKL